MKDTYRSIAEAASATFRELGSKFLAFAYPIETVVQALEFVEQLRKEYHDATHYCYAYRIGLEGVTWRANDDGEPNGSAGLPILGQLRSADITNCLVVVVRYFGGTKLGIPGLINAYRSSTIAVIDAAQIIECQANTTFEIAFDYESMNSIMKAVKAFGARIISQTTDNRCRMQLSVRQSLMEETQKKLSTCATIIKQCAS